jgi:hypothetical protein
MMRSVALLAMVAGFAAPRMAIAQGSIAGTWSTEFDIGIRNENGVETSMGKRQATLVLTLKGDSVFGSWTVAAAAGLPSPPAVKISGVRSGSKFVFQQEPVERTVNSNGEERRIKMVSKYAVEIHGDEMTGTTQNVALDKSFDGPERTFSAKRVR